jgi:hypothetical protein
MKSFKEWLTIKENYQPEVTGILKVRPETTELINMQNKVLAKFPDLKPLPTDKLHVTMLHQKLAKPLSKVSVPVLDASLSFDVDQVYSVEREGKRSVFVIANEQAAIKDYMNNLGKNLGIELQIEPSRLYHVTLANLTGNPADSVGHSEENPITNGAVKVDL